MRFGVRLGVDPGDARIGVASSDPSGFLATPVETVRSGKGDVRRLAQLVTELEAVEVVVGLPRSLNGTEGPAAAKARARGLSAGELVRAVGPLLGGKGGGKDDVAQGGGTDASRIDEALALVTREVAEKVQG